MHTHAQTHPRDPNVIRIPIVPGCDPRQAYGDLTVKGIRGIILESFGVGNMPDLPQQGWMPWLRSQRKKGLMVYLGSQCLTGPMHPELYKAGSVAIEMGMRWGVVWFTNASRVHVFCMYALYCMQSPLLCHQSCTTVIHIGCASGPRMTVESAVVKMMQCLAYPDIPLGVPIAGEM